MGKFAKPQKQAESVVKALSNDKTIRSFGTARNYTTALMRVAEYVKSFRLGSLRDITPDQAITYLERRGEEVGQKQLDMERQAMQAMMQNLTGKLQKSERLRVVKSELQQIKTSRSYTYNQVKLVHQAQRSQNALATQIAYSAGLRGHELLTLRRMAERCSSNRPALDTKFQGRAGERYTVKGKGGLIREVRIPAVLAKQLEEKRLDSPRRVTDRGIHYQQHYEIGGGNSWSKSFGQASKKELGWSAGAHGVRHSYAQERMYELQRSIGLTRPTALATVSQELGHFRPSITEEYLR